MKKNKTKGSQEAYVQAVFFTEKGTRWFRFERAEPPKPPIHVHVKILTEKDKKA